MKHLHNIVKHCKTLWNTHKTSWTTSKTLLRGLPNFFFCRNRGSVWTTVVTRLLVPEGRNYAQVKKFKTKNMYHEVSNIVCFWTFSVKHIENDLHRKYSFFGRGPCGKYILFYNFTDITKFMILFHLQRLLAKRHVQFFSIIKKENLEKY